MLRVSGSISPALGTEDSGVWVEDVREQSRGVGQGHFSSDNAQRTRPSSVINEPKSCSRVEQHSGLDLRSRVYLPEHTAPDLAAQAGCTGELMSVPGCATIASWSHCASDFIFCVTPMFEHRTL